MPEEFAVVSAGEVECSACRALSSASGTASDSAYRVNDQAGGGADAFVLVRVEHIVHPLGEGSQFFGRRRQAWRDSGGWACGRRASRTSDLGRDRGC